METIFRTRYLAVIAVFFGAIGAVLMFVIGAVTTVDSVVTYFGGHEDAAFSTFSWISRVDMATPFRIDVCLSEVDSTNHIDSCQYDMISREDSRRSRC